MATIRTVVIQWDSPGKNTYTIINENWNINDELLPPSLQENYECLIPHVPFVAPDYDPRIYNLITSKMPTELPHPIYPTQNQWLITYSVERKADADILVALESAENLSNEQAFPAVKYKKLNILALNALRKYAQGLVLTPFETALFHEIARYSNAFYANQMNAENYKDIITGGGVPNMDEGWTTSID